MVGPHMRGRGGTPAFKAATTDTAGPDGRPLLRAGFANRTPAP
jgi:hypothetical protein